MLTTTNRTCTKKLSNFANKPSPYSQCGSPSASMTTLLLLGSKKLSSSTIFLSSSSSITPTRKLNNMRKLLCNSDSIRAKQNVLNVNTV